MSRPLIDLNFWPRNLAVGNFELVLQHLEARRKLIATLSPDLRRQALEALQTAEKKPGDARFALHGFLADRLERLPLVSEDDQRQIEIILGSLLPNDFDLRSECPKCLGPRVCGCKT